MAPQEPFPPRMVCAVDKVVLVAGPRVAPVARSTATASARRLSTEVAAVKFLAVPGSHASPAAPKVSMVVLAKQIGTTLQIVFAFATRVNRAHHYHVHCPTMHITFRCGSISLFEQCYYVPFVRVRQKF